MHANHFESFFNFLVFIYPRFKQSKGLRSFFGNENNDTNRRVSITSSFRRRNSAATINASTLHGKDRHKGDEAVIVEEEIDDEEFEDEEIAITKTISLMIGSFDHTAIKTSSVN